MEDIRKENDVTYYLDKATGLYSTKTPEEVQLGRRGFLFPDTRIIDQGKEPPSTLDMESDIWGRCPTHYRWINDRSAPGHKKIALIGEAHLYKSETPLILIRINEVESKYYKHWPIAVKLYMERKLEYKYEDWLKEEGAVRWYRKMVPMLKSDGITVSPEVSTLLHLGVIRKVDNEYVLSEEFTDAITSIPQEEDTPDVPTPSIVDWDGIKDEDGF